jgi:NAD(P)-dependent dehydrogenase (short-subunit alcohol dehydrogenase family)
MATKGTGGRPVAIVTGAGGGLGGAIARALASAGFDLVLNDLEVTEHLVGLCAELATAGAQARPLAQDIARDNELAAFVEDAHSQFGRLDCLVNNAGVSVLSRGDVLDVTPQSFDRCVGVNLRAQFFLTQAFAKRLVRDRTTLATSHLRPSIITITTVAVDDIVGTVLAEYGIAKAGLSHMVKHFAVRLAPLGIDCYEVRPGMLKTSMTESSRAKYDALIESGFVPAQRWGELDDVGHTVASLAGGALRYAVGQIISTDGGMRLKAF